MMKVLFITNNYPTDKNPVFGVFVKEQIDSLNKKGIKSELLFINGREKGKIEYLRSISRIRKVLANNHYDIIHCHHAISAICLLLSGRNKTPKIVSYQSEPRKELGLKVNKILKRKFNGVILKNTSNFSEPNLFYQPNGVDLSFFKQINRLDAINKLSLDPSKRYVLFLSSNFNRPEKRYDRFVSVMEVLRDRYAMSNIEELVLINEKRKLMPYYFNASSLHLLVSDFEGSPNSVKESLACNTPVVSTNVGNVSEMLSGVDGSYVSSSNCPEDIAALVAKVLDDKNEYNSRSMLIQKKLDIDSVANNIINIYNELLSK